MNRKEFLERIYNNGIKQAKGKSRKALCAARDCYLLADDLLCAARDCYLLADDFRNTRPDVSKKMALRGLRELFVEQNNEAYNLLWGALNSLAS